MSSDGSLGNHDHQDVLASLYDIGLALTSNLDLAGVLELVGESARSVLKADLATCHRYDRETNTYALAADVGRKLVPNLDRTPTPDGPTAAIVHTGSVLFSNDARSEDTPYRNSRFTQAENVCSVMGLPLKKGDEIIGVLYINYRKPGMITEEVRRRAQMLANQAAVAVCNADLFRRLTEREAAMSRLLEVVQSISEAIAASDLTDPRPSVKFVLDEIARTACELTAADCAVIYPYDSAREEFYEADSVGAWGNREHLQPSDRPRSAAGMAAYVRGEGLIVRNNIPEEDPAMLRSPFIEREGVEAFVGVAVHVHETHLGVLYVNFREPHRFDTDEIRVIQLFANQAAVALQIARLLQKEQSARINLENLELMNAIGSALGHRVIGILGTTPVETTRIRDRLTALEIESPEINKSLDRIEGDTVRAMEMASALKRVEELQGTPEPTDINETLASVLKQLVRPPICLSESYGAGLPLTNVPKRQVAEVFENIGRNAVEHMPEGGTLTARTQLVSGRLIEVIISNTGPELDLAKQEKIFELFYSGRRRKGGLGFGLWWSRTFMRRIGGDVSVWSAPGQGCSFAVAIPVIAPR